MRDATMPPLLGDFEMSDDVKRMAATIWMHRAQTAEARNTELEAALAKAEEMEAATDQATLKMLERNAKLVAALRWLEDYEPTIAAIMREKFDLNETS